MPIAMRRFSEKPTSRRYYKYLKNYKNNHNHDKMNKMSRKSKSGFTLAELSFAIVFISILVLTSAFVTVNMIRTYHKGITMKTINSVGLELINEFTSAVTASPIVNYETLCAGLANSAGCEADQAKAFIYGQFKFDVEVTKNGSSATRDLPIAGVFCTGKYSYFWNTGYAIQNKEADGSFSAAHGMSSGFYKFDDGPFDGGFRLRKYLDNGRKLCSGTFEPVDPADPSKGKKYPTSGATVARSRITAALSDMDSSSIIAEEMINATDIAIYSFTVYDPVIDEQSKRALYNASFVLGSITGDIEVHNDYAGCNVEDTISFDVEYCATNKFNFAIRATGGNSGS